MKNLFIILLAGILATGCVQYDIAEILLDRPDISVTHKGNEIYSFSPNKAQISFNDARNEYRIFNENFLSKVILVWDEQPSYQGQKVTIDITWRTPTNYKKKKGLKFEVKKVSNDGLIWLWNSSDNIGVTIKVI